MIGIAYLAGFFDGEGCIEIQKWVSKDLILNPYYTLRISATQVNPEPLYKLQETFKGVVHCRDARPLKNQRTVYKWRCKSVQAAHALQCMLPYLIVKSDEAKLALEFQNPINSKRTGWHGKLTVEELNRRELLRCGIRELKKREYA